MTPNSFPAVERDEFFVGLGMPFGSIAVISGVENIEKLGALEEEKAAAVDRALARSDEELQDHPILQSYRASVSKLGRSVKRFPPSAQTLHQSVRRTGRLPTLNAVVDSYNIEALDSFLAFGVHDLSLIEPPISFRAAINGEPFQAVGSPDCKTTQAGDYVYADRQRVLAWLDSRDSELVKVSLATTDVLLIVQGTSETSSELTYGALCSACQRIVRHCGGTFQVKPLWADGVTA